MSNKLLNKPRKPLPEGAGKFQQFHLAENPFPAEPTVNKDSKDKRINGNIYEMEIRQHEYEQFNTAFLKRPQADPNHLRLGYLIDTSYIGRGNGKTAFLVNLQQDINREYCLDLSEGLNKCFAIYLSPDLGGRTKTFLNFADLLFQALLSSQVIENCLASLRLEAIGQLYPDQNLDMELADEKLLVNHLNSENWFGEHNFDIVKIVRTVFKNEYLQDIPNDFPLFQERNSLIPKLVSSIDFKQHYLDLKAKDRLDFLFSHLIRFFQAANFNGAYVLIDDFERIPDFQSARQKRDFALELRSCLFDGLYVNARLGFYNFLLVLHAGVQRLISDAWTQSGMENRAPLSPQTASRHIIPFEKLSREHASLLLKKYLAEYRTEKTTDALFPFTEDAVGKMGELSEYNAAKILKMAYDLLEKAVALKSTPKIDAKFVTEHIESQSLASYSSSLPTIDKADTIDLQKKLVHQEE